MKAYHTRVEQDTYRAARCFEFEERTNRAFFRKRFASRRRRSYSYGWIDTRRFSSPPRLYHSSLNAQHFSPACSHVLMRCFSGGAIPPPPTPRCGPQRLPCGGPGRRLATNAWLAEPWEPFQTGQPAE